MKKNCKKRSGLGKGGGRVEGEKRGRKGRRWKKGEVGSKMVKGEEG
jgi:hypothetical protein